MEKILVTCASGFIGFELTKSLLGRDYELFLFSRNINRLLNFKNKNVRKFEVNFIDPSSLYNHDIKRIDTVIHLAASISYFGNKKKLYNANVASAINLYKWGKEKEVKRFIFASSIEAMGVRGEPSPATENDLCKPASSYGESKLQAENALIEQNKDNAMELVILRIGNVFGPRGPFFVVSLAEALLSKNKYYRYSPCYSEQKFQLIYIDDVVDGIFKTIEGKTVEGTYILAGSEPMKVADILRLVSKKLGKNFEYKGENQGKLGYLLFRKKVLEILHRGDLLSFMVAGSEIGNRRIFSVEKAKKELGFSPRVSVKAGIEKTLEWAKKEGVLKGF